MEWSDEVLEKLLHEKAVLKPDMPGMLLVLSKLNDAADKLPLKLMECDPNDIMTQARIRALYDVMKTELPRIFTTIMNVDVEPGKDKWSFWKWLKRG
jgi:hypothetical protein